MAGDPLKKLSPRKRIYVKERSKGKSKTAAALTAGYALSTAENAKDKIETPEVMEAFRALLRKTIPAEKIATRIAEGLDAMETKLFQFKGEITASRDVIAWGERRAYAELAAEYGGYHLPKRPQESTTGGDKVRVILIGIASA